MNRKIVPIVLASLVLGLLFDVLFYDKPLGISVLIYSILIAGSLMLLGGEFRHRLNSTIYLLLGAVLFLAGMLAVRASGMLFFFNIALIIYLLLLMLKLSQNPGIPLREYPLSGYVSAIPGLPFGILQRSTAEIRSLVSRNSGIPGSYAPWIRGVVLSLPFLIVFVLLLSSADAVFHEYVGSLFDFHLNGRLVSQLVIIGFVTAAFIGAFALFFMPETPVKAGAESGGRGGLGSTEASIMLGSVSALFCIFLLVQLTYLFGGEDRVLSTGLTYAEYARQGFFELIAVAVITMGMMLGVKKYAKLTDNRSIGRFTWLSVILIIEVLIIMLSAHLRLTLYEDTYGFTRQRLFSHLFIVWLAAAFVLFAVFLVRKQHEKTFALSLFISVLAFFAVLNILNPDALVARQNVARYTRTGKLDQSYLMKLSEDATPETVKLLERPGKQEVITLQNHLYLQKLNLDCNYDQWQSINWSRQQARQLLKDKQLAYQGSVNGAPGCHAEQD
jgi:hypothetical protein